MIIRSNILEFDRLSKPLMNPVYNYSDLRIFSLCLKVIRLTVVTYCTFPFWHHQDFIVKHHLLLWYLTIYL